MQRDAGEINKIFVYGTLMLRFPENPFYTLLHKHLMMREQAYVNGRLYLLGSYPGMIKGDGITAGELLTLNNFNELLPVLDEYEEFYANQPERSLYVRELTFARTRDEKAHTCWTYWYQKEVNPNDYIVSGRFW
jgi:pyruvate carboxylase